MIRMRNDKQITVSLRILGPDGDQKLKEALSDYMKHQNFSFSFNPEGADL